MFARQGILKEHSSLLVFTFRTLDLVAIVLSGLFAFRIEANHWQVGEGQKLAIVLAVLAALFFFNHFSLYRTWRGIRTAVELRAITIAWCSVFISLVSIFAFTGAFASMEARWLGYWLMVAWLFLVSFRMTLRLALRWVRSYGLNQRTIAFVGISNRGNEIAHQIEEAAWAGLQVLGYFDDRKNSRDVEDKYLRYLGTIDDLAKYAEHNHIDQVWMVYPLRAENRVNEVLVALRNTTVDIRFALDIFSFKLCNHSINEIAGIPVLNLSATPMWGINPFLKALEDRLLALTILLLVSPIMLLIAIGVKVSSPGPVFYRQVRVSWNGKYFNMLKFRSMPVDAENATGAVWAKKGEQRATRFGAFLRRTSLDELPQFINVLNGDMSIVGPRPERPVFVDQFKEEIPLYMKKHLMKAGITGWAQVNGWRGDTDLSKRIEHDIYYIEHWSLWFDLRIVLMTLFKGLINRNAY